MLADTTCCGVDEIEGLESTPEKTLLEVCYEKYDDEGWGGISQQAFILITDTVKCGRGDALTKFILKNKLGTIAAPVRARRNPNSGNMIKAWIWSPHETNLRAWWRKNRKKHPDYDPDEYSY